MQSNTPQLAYTFLDSIIEILSDFKQYYDMGKTPCYFYLTRFRQFEINFKGVKIVKLKTTSHEKHQAFNAQ